MASTAPLPAGVGKEPKQPTASSAHDMLIATAILSVFVYAMVLLAGEGPNAGRAVILLFILLIFLQGVGHVNLFAQWVVNHPLQPQRV